MNRFSGWKCAVDHEVVSSSISRYVAYHFILMFERQETKYTGNNARIVLSFQLDDTLSSPTSLFHCHDNHS